MSVAFETTQDRILGGKVRLDQPAQGYRAAIDPVLLAASVPALGHESLLEPGIGAGAAALCLLAREPDLKLTGIEQDAAAASLCRHNAKLNNRQIEVLEGSISQAHDLGLFDHVYANPPFHDTHKHGRGLAASHMPLSGLAAWVAFAFRHLKDRGSFTLIHRADMLDILLSALTNHDFGAIKVLPVQPRAEAPAKRVIVQALKARKTPLELLPALIVHNEDGSYTARSRAILEDGATLAL